MRLNSQSKSQKRWSSLFLGSLSSSESKYNELYTRHAPKPKHLRKLSQISNALACNNFGRSWDKFGGFHSRYVSIKHCLQVYRVSTNLCYFSIFFYIGWLFNKSLSIYASSASKQQMWQLSQLAVFNFPTTSTVRLAM